MKDLTIFLILLITLTGFLFYKVTKEVISLFNYKKGATLKAKVIAIEWIKSPPTRLSCLFPKEQLRILFQFQINNETYQKYDNDVHFKYTKENYKILPKPGSIIDVYITRNKNPNKVTINKIEKTIAPLFGLFFLILLCCSIIFLVSYNHR